MTSLFIYHECINMLRIAIFLTVFSAHTLLSQSVLLNEVMSSNVSVLSDEDGDYPDWIEIFNPTDSVINLLNYTISDDLEITPKWTFPEYIISPNEYLIVFCSGKNKVTENLHTNFKIKSPGEELWLRDSTGQIIDYVDSVEISSDISFGRILEKVSEWAFYSIPTPGAKNNTDSYGSKSREPVFTLESGYYNGVQRIEIINFSDSTVYYTIDGSEPTKNSLRYNTPIEIGKTTVIKTKCFEKGLLPSSTITNTYLINENRSLPAISISTDPKNFFDDEIGIYVDGTNGVIGNCSDLPRNYNRDWERPTTIEFFDSMGTKIFNINCGIKIFGGCTRTFPQKSLEIIARGKYGSSVIPYKIFHELPFTNYESIVLRNSGNDVYKTFIRDALMHGLVDEFDLETQSYRPAVLYINGEYWGIYNIRERNNKDYLKQHNNIDPFNIDYLREKYTVIEGDNRHYKNMYSFTQLNDLSIDSNYNYIKEQMNIQNYITYMISEIFFANKDWYPNNTKFWRPKTDIGKWRWVLFDTDFGFQTSGINMIDWVSNTDKYPSVIFNGLIKNDKFKKEFINTCADYLNKNFNVQKVIKKISDYAARIENEIPRHTIRWQKFSQNWYDEIEILKEFAINRPAVMRENFINEFDLGGNSTIELKINDSEYGVIKINSIEIDQSPWSGVYFDKNPIEVSVKCKPGYKFSYWLCNDSIYSTRNRIEFLPNKVSSLTAILDPDLEGVSGIVINEINYKSSIYYESQDWIELLNIGDSIVNLSNWCLRDENNSNSFYFNSNINIKKHEYLIICADSVSFKNIYPNVDNIVGEINFKFSNDGELIRLYNSSMYLVDSVRYSSKSPWPEAACGGGKTLELLNPLNSNDFIENWNESSLLGGTPGAANSDFIKDNIYLNEMLAINNSSIHDESGEYEDWIELYNTANISIPLKQIYITDDLTKKLKFNLANDSNPLVVESNNFLLLWADDEKGEGGTHTNFKLNGKGEQIGIFQYNGIETLLIDSLSFLEQNPDESLGRYPDAYERWKRFIQPTPLIHNSNLSNHPPFFKDGFIKEYIIESDSLLSINLWEYVEDVETPDSLLKYSFEVSSNSIRYNYFIDEGQLDILLNLSNNEIGVLYIKIQDNENLLSSDSIKFIQAKLLNTNESENFPTEYSLSQNFPNPFNPVTFIKFGLPKKSLVSLTIYNNLGERIAVIIDEEMKAGFYEKKFNSAEYSSGIYFYQIIAGDFFDTKKMILLK